MSDNALRAVIHQLPVDERFGLAHVDARIANLALTWSDVEGVIVDDYKIAMGGKSMNHTIRIDSDQNLPDALDWTFGTAPAVRWLIIQNRLSEQALCALNTVAPSVRRLSIAADNFGKHVVDWTGVQFSRLRSLNVLQRENDALCLTYRIPKSIVPRLFVASLRTVCLTGILLTPEVVEAIASLKNLRWLDLIGAAADTKIIAPHFEKLAELESLEHVSVPPSVFSFSAKATYEGTTMSFKKFQVAKLALYMELYDMNHFWMQMKTILPMELKMLVLYGNVYRMKNCKRLAAWKGCEIQFGPMTSIASGPQWAVPGDYRLLNHMVRKSPYIPSIPLPGTPESWKLDIAAIEAAELAAASAPRAGRLGAMRGRGRGGARRGGLRRRPQEVVRNAPNDSPIVNEPDSPRPAEPANQVVLPNAQQNPRPQAEVAPNPRQGPPTPPRRPFRRVQRGSRGRRGRGAAAPRAVRRLDVSTSRSTTTTSTNATTTSPVVLQFPPAERSTTTTTTPTTQADTPAAPSSTASLTVSTPPYQPPAPVPLDLSVTSSTSQSSTISGLSNATTATTPTSDVSVTTAPTEAQPVPADVIVIPPNEVAPRPEEQHGDQEREQNADADEVVDALVDLVMGTIMQAAAEIDHENAANGNRTPPQNDGNGNGS